MDEKELMTSATPYSSYVLPISETFMILETFEMLKVYEFGSHDH
jgi:hypothetical protein